jgi:hypothetical protein
MINAYLRAAANSEALRLQAAEKLQARQTEVAPAELLEPIEAVDVQVIERARDPETGQFLADDPTTSDINEAWEITP